MESVLRKAHTDQSAILETEVTIMMVISITVMILFKYEMIRGRM